MSPRVGSYGETPTVTRSPGDDLDPESSHPTAQLRKHLVAWVTLHPIEASAVDCRDHTLYVGVLCHVLS